MSVALPSTPSRVLGGPRLVATLALALGVAPGCGPSAFDLGLPMFPGPVSEDGCVSSVSWVEHVDEPTPLGFSALDVLARLGGEGSFPLDWIEPEPSEEYELAYGPEQGRSSLVLDIRPGEGQILHRWREPLLDAPEDTECGPPVIEVPVEVTLTSGGNALNETFEAVLSASVPYRAHLSKRLRPRAVSGAFAVGRLDSLDPERRFALSELTIEAELWPGGSRGTLGAELYSDYAKPSEELRAAPVQPSQPGPFAVWPSARECGGAKVALPSDARVLGFSVLDVLERLRQAGPRQLTWNDGSVTPVRLTPAEPERELCQELGESLSFEVLLHAESMDGGLGVDLPVNVDVVDAGGNIGEIAIESSGPRLPHPVAELARERRSVVRVGDYAAVLIDMRWSLGAGQDSGELTLRGVDGATPDAEGNYSSTALSSARW
jgi:hypothetical protein